MEVNRVEYLLRFESFSVHANQFVYKVYAMGQLKVNEILIIMPQSPLRNASKSRVFRNQRTV